MNFSYLSDEIIINILNYIDLTNIDSMYCINNHFNEILSSKYYWKQRLKDVNKINEFESAILIDNSNNYKDIYIQIQLQHCDSIYEVSSIKRLDKIFKDKPFDVLLSLSYDRIQLFMSSVYMKYHTLMIKKRKNKQNYKKKRKKYLKTLIDCIISIGIIDPSNNLLKGQKLALLINEVDYNIIMETARIIKNNKLTNSDLLHDELEWLHWIKISGLIQYNNIWKIMFDVAYYHQNYQAMLYISEYIKDLIPSILLSKITLKNKLYIKKIINILNISNDNLDEGLFSSSVKPNIYLYMLINLYN